jgi:hypothetical protein
VNPDPSNASVPSTPPEIPTEPPLALPVLSYATPTDYQSGILRDGRYIVLPIGTPLPDRCIKCGQPATVYFPVSFTLVFPFQPIKLRVGMCRHHARLERLPRQILGAMFATAGLFYSVIVLIDRSPSPNSMWSDLVERGVPSFICIVMAAALLLAKKVNV